MKIWDCITIFNELDLLEMRMEILDKYVDYFVVNEATTTFSGNPKSLYFQKNKDRFKKFGDKIVCHVFSENKPEWDQWDRDKIHKNASMQALVDSNCADDDIIFYSDADEIPNFEAFNLKEIYTPDKLFICYQDCYYYYLNTLWKFAGNPRTDTWRGTKFSSWGLLKKYSIDMFRDWTSYFHKFHADDCYYIDKAGWHFSFLGGADNIKLKIASYGHQELNIPFITDNIQKKIDELKDPFNRDNFEIISVEMTEKTHPKYVIDNLDKYNKYIRKP